MAYRHRRRSYRRKPQNVVWQPYYVHERITAAAPNTASGIKSGVMNAKIVPGVHKPVSDTDTGEEFKDDHILERVRGSVVHDASESTNVAERPHQFPFTMAMMRLPKGLNISSDDINLWDPTEGSDYFYYGSHICDLTGQLTPNIETVDNKAKRKFEVGDTIAFLWSLLSPGTTAVTVDITMNLRFLWKLKV